MSTLAKRMRHLREINGYTQAKVAKALGISNVQLSRYELGERKPDPETLKAIADFYEASTDYLLGIIDTHNHRSSTGIDMALNDLELDLWFKEIRAASPENQEKLREFWEFIMKKEKGRKLGDRHQ